jgi:phosphoribosylaminoimidazolecarboxamide formyltransferase/IMP cyclohydrolase
MISTSGPGRTDNLIPVQTVLLSVADKTGLDYLVASLVSINPGVRLLSTGGTFKEINKILGPDSERLMEVSEYTGFPEMPDGLVKTLHPKIHAGILAGRNKPSHREYLEQTVNGVIIDMIVVNLYPFEKTVARPGITFDQARDNIDIGGPTMIRGAAKNFLGCAVVCDPSDYGPLVEHLKTNNGNTTLDERFSLARKVLDRTANYDKAIVEYLSKFTPKEIAKLYLTP